MEYDYFSITGEMDIKFDGKILFYCLTKCRHRILGNQPGRIM